MRKITRRSHGFTLIELLVALTIASVLTAIALPTLKESLRQNALSRSASLVKGAFINARAQAITTGRPFGLVIERRLNDLGSGDPTTMDFVPANYATRLYYVQSPIEYRGDVETAIAIPTFNPIPGVGIVRSRVFLFLKRTHRCFMLPREERVRRHSG